ncbi:MAG: hypothetical protein N4A74_12065 [Carboxylicivirga sp.]|jgi:uncharacterized Tic20 family protein|nr:hypothetical protein [Carboxylicivirga sp.]
MIWIISTVAFFCFLGSIVLWISYKTRTTPLEEGQKELVLKGISFNLSPFVVMAILLIGAILSKDDDLTFMYLTALLCALLIKSTEIMFQLYIKKDRLILGEEQLIFKTASNIKVNWKTIDRISLHGVFNWLYISGNTTIGFNVKRIKTEDLNLLIKEIKGRAESTDLKVSDNLSKV